MKPRSSFILLFLLAISSILHSQGFKPPFGENAVIYFVRVTDFMPNAKFEFFDGDKFFGTSRVQNYLRHECEAGEHLFLAASENNEFMTAELLPGKSYIVIVDVIIGFWKAHVGLSPLSIENKELFMRAKDIIKNKPPIETSPEKMEKMDKRYKKFITEILGMYDRGLKDRYNFRHLGADMAIPEEEMK
jgi:hypothetical protein